MPVLGGAEVIRIVLAMLSDDQRAAVERSLDRANTRSTAAGASPQFQYKTVEGRGIRVLEQAADVQVAVLGLDDDVLPGEASHLVAAYPEVKVIGVDARGTVRAVLGSVSGAIRADLPTVIRCIVRGSAEPRADRDTSTPGERAPEVE